ncbi:hypothetical protein AOLI_G00198340 [Acnodon oligacanthus]
MQASAAAPLAQADSPWGHLGAKPKSLVSSAPCPSEPWKEEVASCCTTFLVDLNNAGGKTCKPSAKEVVCTKAMLRESGSLALLVRGCGYQARNRAASSRAAHV